MRIWLSRTGALGVTGALAACSLLVQCTSTPSKENAQSAPVHRYVAWMEGDVQSSYEPDRKIAEEKLAEWEGSVPEPSDTDRYISYLSVLDASGRSADAEKKIKAYLAVKPQEKRAVFLLAVHYLRAKKKDLAGYFFNSLEKEASFPWKSLLYNNLGMLALEDKNRQGAIGYFEKAVNVDPATAAPLVNLGALYLQSRSFADAEKMFSRAYNIDKEFEDAVLGLGSALEGQGKFDEAHRVYAEFMQNNPNALSVVYNDSIVLGTRLKQRDQAAQQMLRYIQRGGKETAKAQEIIQSWR